MRQVAALPFRSEADGSLCVMLITSRETHRWVLPKGNPIKGLAGHEAAAQEAYEEAGLQGVVGATPIGRYHYAKRRRSGRARTMAVDVYPLAVTGRAEAWPEQDQRTCAWFGVDQASQAVEEPELKSILAGFREPPALPPPGEAKPAAAPKRVGWLKALLQRRMGARSTGD